MQALRTLLSYLFALAISAPLSFAQVSSTQDFTKIARDLEGLERGGVSFFRTSLQHYRIGVVRAREFGWQRASVRSLARASQAALAINANFFDQAGKPLGLIISRGTLVQDIHRGGNVLTGIFLFRGPRTLAVVHRSAFTREGVMEAVQAGPRLLEKRNRVEGLKDAEVISRRSGVCIDGKGRLILFASSSNLAGLGLAALQDLLLTPQLDCIDSLNFDGGRSSQLYLSPNLSNAVSGHAELSIQGVEEVPVVLGLFAK